MICGDTSSAALLIFFKLDFIGIILYCGGWAILSSNQVLTPVLCGGEPGACSLVNPTQFD